MSFNINKQLNADEQEPKATEVDEQTATTNEPVQTETETKSEPVATAHDDFDWSRIKETFLLTARKKRKVRQSI